MSLPMRSRLIWLGSSLALTLLLSGGNARLSAQTLPLPDPLTPLNSAAGEARLQESQASTDA
ncbi:hypothetical protein, partial [Haemophilus parainfluenzae]|uniref:hypothetical protein n=1 Tax=Haemophilus parainfluenzae TaxID=729 RepID=UPI001CED889C